jgi:hypothetical protein
MSEGEREARREESDTRLKAVDERLERLFAPQIPSGAASQPANDAQADLGDSTRPAQAPSPTCHQRRGIWLIANGRQAGREPVPPRHRCVTALQPERTSQLLPVQV